MLSEEMDGSQQSTHVCVASNASAKAQRLPPGAVVCYWLPRPYAMYIDPLKSFVETWFTIELQRGDCGEYKQNLQTCVVQHVFACSRSKDGKNMSQDRSSVLPDEDTNKQIEEPKRNGRSCRPRKKGKVSLVNTC